MPTSLFPAGDPPTRARHLSFVAVDLETARGLVRRWHSSLPVLDRRVSGWVAFAAEGADGAYYAVTVWGWPVARGLPADGRCLELRRMAVAQNAPRNTASRMLAADARRLAAERPSLTRLVSYHDPAAHLGTIYKAAGWTPFPAHRGGGWDGKRKQGVRGRIPGKVRWEKVVRVKAEFPVAPLPLSRQLTFDDL